MKKLAFALSILLLAGCAGMQSKSDQPPKGLEDLTETGKTKWSEYGDYSAAEILDADTFLVRDVNDTTLAATGTQKEYPWSVMKTDLEVWLESLSPTFTTGTWNFTSATAITFGAQPIITTGLVDGLTNVTITTDGTENANPAGQMSHYIFNQNTTEAATFTVTLADPPIKGMQLVAKNSYGDGITTGVITLVVPAGDFIWNPTTAAMCTDGQDLVSGGAAGDFVGVVAASTTFWEVIGFQGVWSCN